MAGKRFASITRRTLRRAALAQYLVRAGVQKRWIVSDGSRLLGVWQHPRTPANGSTQGSLWSAICLTQFWLLELMPCRLFRCHCWTMTNWMPWTVRQPQRPKQRVLPKQSLQPPLRRGNQKQSRRPSQRQRQRRGLAHQVRAAALAVHQARVAAVPAPQARESHGQFAYVCVEYVAHPQTAKLVS